MDSNGTFDAVEALRAVRAAAAQEEQRKQPFRDWERRIEQALAERKSPSSAGRLRVVPPLPASRADL